MFQTINVCVNKKTTDFSQTDSARMSFMIMRLCSMGPTPSHNMRITIYVPKMVTGILRVHKHCYHIGSYHT